MNTELRKLAKNDFEKDLFKLMNNSLFAKTMENMRKHRDIKLVTTNKKRRKLVSEPNYHAMNLISENLSIIEMKKTNKPIYLDDMNDVLDDINNYNKNRDKKVLIVFDDMIADIEYNKNFKRIIKELFYRARKINVSIVFITQSYFRALKDARLNSTHYILIKIGTKKELKSIEEEKSGHLDYKDF